MHKVVCGNQIDIQNMNLILKLTECIELSLLPKLSKSYDESQNHFEYEVRLKNIDYHFPLVIKLLEEVNLRDKSGAVSSILSTLFIMYKELQSEGAWNNERSKDYASNLNSRFEHLYKMTLDDIMRKNEIFDSQGIFDKCIDNLHRKLTNEDIKKYPGRINVYCTLIQNFQDYNVTFNSISTFPVTLLLIDDYIINNKVQGLKCCRTLLKTLTNKHFETGNYYEVIYECLFKTITEKDLEITKLCHECYLDFLNLIPSAEQAKRLNYMFATVLDETNLESNLHRKELLLQFLKSIIALHGVNCVKGQKVFMAIAYDNFDICASFNKGSLCHNILQLMLECLEEWISNCWCVWKLSTDHKLISVLIKVLYVECKDNNYKLAPENSAQILIKIHKIISALISLCSKEEQQKITTNFERCLKVPNKEFVKRIEKILQEIKV